MKELMGSKLFDRVEMTLLKPKWSALKHYNFVGGLLLTSLVLGGPVQAAEYKISGQVSRMMVIPDDASGSETQFQDIGWSGTRFRFTGNTDIGDGMKAGFRLEVQLQSNAANGTSGGGQTDGGNDDAIDNRYQDIWFSGDFGRVSLGKGDGAGNGSTEVDLSGTALSSSSNHQDNWGNYRVAPGVTWDSIFTMTDALSRVNRVRYDTVNMNGFGVAVSLDQGNAVELALKYAADLNGGKVAFQIFTVDNSDFPTAGIDQGISGFSGSLLLAGGFNVTLAFSDDDRGAASDRDATTVKLGYKMGKHAFAVDFGQGSTGSVDADTVGLTYASQLMGGVEVFATWRQLDADFTGAESVDLIALGTRIKF